MKGLTKKIAALTIAAVMVMASFVGCSNASINKDEVVATVGDREITLGLANFYIRYQQSALESIYMSYYGDAMWTLEVGEDGETYEENVRETAVESIKHLYILEDHMDDYNVTLTEEDLAAIESVADTFIKANEADVLEVISGDKEIVKEVLKLSTISYKMETAMTADVNTEVSDDEAAQKKLQYITFSKTKTAEDGTSSEMTDEEVAVLKTEAETFLTNAKAKGDLEAYAKEIDKASSSITFDKDSTTLDKELITAADSLGEKEFSGVLETDTAFYVMQLVSLFDEEATETEKENIVAERKNEKYNEIYEAWEEETPFELNEKVLAKIDLQNMGITVKTEEETEK